MISESRLRQPIEIPDPDAGRVEIVRDIQALIARKAAYDQISSIALVPQWENIRRALQEIQDQYTQKLLSAKGDEIVRCQEAVKAYKFLASMPSSALKVTEEIDKAIDRLRVSAGIDGGN